MRFKGGREGLSKPGGFAGCSAVVGVVASPSVKKALGTSLVVALMLAAGAQAGNRTAGMPLELGQGMTIAGTDLVCGFGGLAGHAGITCASNGPTATKNSWAFRLEEGRLVVSHFLNGNTASQETWNEPKTQPEPAGAGGTSGLSNVGTARVGTGFFADGTDLGCGVATFGGRVGVGCAKRDSSGAADVGSYGIEMTETTVQVLHVEANSAVETVFTATTAAAAGPFRIGSVSSPASIKQNGPKEAMVIHWTGHPAFPVTVHTAAASCPSGLTCSSGTGRFEQPTNPLRWIAWACNGNLTKNWTLDYWIWVTDAGGRSTQKVRQKVVCDVG